jgi:aryl-alcohol dehydrogenase-like predicted oxidoreductase
MQEPSTPGTAIGRPVGSLCLGTMYLGTLVDEATSFAILDRFLEAGGTFVDTANTYAFWVDGGTGRESEALLGRWLASRRARDRVVLATKVGALPEPPGASWPEHAQGLSAPVIAREADGSLRRLGTDRIDLYYAHIEDRGTPPEETMGAFAGLVAAGKVGVVGCSNHAAWRVERALCAARSLGWSGYRVVQAGRRLRPR